MISAPSEMRCRLISNISMNTNVMASTSGMLIGHHEARAHSQAHETHDQHDDDGLEQTARELPDRFLDHLGLVGDAMHVDAHRQIAFDAR